MTRDTGWSRELRLADARTIDQATAVLQDFLPRFNARFAVQPEHPEAAYRSGLPELCVSETLCFKHTRKVARDNTVRLADARTIDQATAVLQDFLPRFNAVRVQPDSALYNPAS